MGARRPAGPGDRRGLDGSRRADTLPRVTTLPPVTLPRLGFWCHRHGRRARQISEDILLAGADDRTNLALQVTDGALAVYTYLTGSVPREQVEAVREVVDELGAREPAPVIVLRVEEPAADAEQAEGPDPLDPAGVSVTARVEQPTSVVDGMTDAQMDAWLNWATALVDSTAADVAATLPLTRPREES